MNDVDQPANRAKCTVRTMTPAEFADWHRASVASYAEDIARATGRPLSAALERAEQQTRELLPDGLQTANTWLLQVLDESGAAAGHLWIGAHPDRPGVAFVFDLEILAAHRGRGLGRAAMTLAEDVVRDAGMSEIGLNVFGFNEPARRLYESLGYRVVSTSMTKRLDRSDDA